MNDYASIADLYDSYVIDTSDHPFWCRWASRAAGAILELTSGTGRATVALHGATSQRVVALDLSHAMAQRLVRRFQQSPRRVLAVTGDLTTLPFVSGHFALVVIPFNSFGEVTDGGMRRAALSDLRRVLTPDGRAIVTLHNPARRRYTLDGQLRRLGPFACGAVRLDLLVRGRLLGSDFAESEQTYRLLDTNDRVIEERRLTLQFVLEEASALVQMAAAAGLEAQALFGDYDESAYTAATSPFIIAVLGTMRAHK